MSLVIYHNNLVELNKAKDLNLDLYFKNEEFRVIEKNPYMGANLYRKGFIKIESSQEIAAGIIASLKQISFNDEIEWKEMLSSLLDAVAGLGKRLSLGTGNQNLTLTICDLFNQKRVKKTVSRIRTITLPERNLYFQRQWADLLKAKGVDIAPIISEIPKNAKDWEVDEIVWKHTPISPQAQYFCTRWQNALETEFFLPERDRKKIQDAVFKLDEETSLESVDQLVLERANKSVIGRNTRTWQLSSGGGACLRSEVHKDYGLTDEDTANWVTDPRFTTRNPQDFNTKIKEWAKETKLKQLSAQLQSLAAKFCKELEVDLFKTTLPATCLARLKDATITDDFIAAEMELYLKEVFLQAITGAEEKNPWINLTALATSLQKASLKHWSQIIDQEAHESTMRWIDKYLPYEMERKKLSLGQRQDYYDEAVGVTIFPRRLNEMKKFITELKVKIDGIIEREYKKAHRLTSALKDAKSTCQKAWRTHFNSSK